MSKLYDASYQDCQLTKSPTLHLRTTAVFILTLYIEIGLGLFVNVLFQLVCSPFLKLHSQGDPANLLCELL